MNLYDDAVGNLLLRPLRLWVMYLPQLAACYLLGLLGRNIVIELAAKYAWNNYLVVDLLMPFAGLARQVDHCDVPGPPLGDSGVGGDAQDLFTQCRHIRQYRAAIFVIYLAWKMFQDDWLTYEQKAMWHRVGAHMTTGTRVVNLGDVPLPITSGY